MPAKRKWTEMTDGFLICDSGDPRFRWCIEIIDLWEACGEEEAREMAGFRGARFATQASLTPIFSVLNEETKDRIRCNIGDEEIFKGWSDEDWVYDIHQYGVCFSVGAKYTRTEKQAIRLGKSIPRPTVEEALEMTVNRAGWSGLQYIKDNLDLPKFEEMDPNAVVHSGSH